MKTAEHEPFEEVGLRGTMPAHESWPLEASFELYPCTNLCSSPDTRVFMLYAVFPGNKSPSGVDGSISSG